jgi:RimJ/RimL family protein N-acetyltransferase
LTAAEVHKLCDRHRASLIENWIDEAERRIWYLFEASRRGGATGHRVRCGVFRKRMVKIRNSDGNVTSWKLLTGLKHNHMESAWMHFLRSCVLASTVARGAIAQSWARCQRMGPDVRRTVDAKPGACGNIAAAESAEMIDFRGRPVFVRRLRAEDRPLIEEFLAGIDSEDLRMRFFSGFRAVSPSLLDHLLRVDDLDRLALVVVGTDGCGRREVLAVGRTHTGADATAELALLVRSNLKGQGLGSALLARLIAHCRNRGISRLVAEVLQQNARMLRLAERFGFRRQDARFGTVRLALELRPTAG